MDLITALSLHTRWSLWSSQALKPAWEQTASALKGIVAVGAIDADAHRGMGSEYRVQVGGSGGGGYRCAGGREGGGGKRCAMWGGAGEVEIGVQVRGRRGGGNHAGGAKAGKVETVQMGESGGSGNRCGWGWGKRKWKWVCGAGTEEDALAGMQRIKTVTPMGPSGDCLQVRREEAAEPSHLPGFTQPCVGS